MISPVDQLDDSFRYINILLLPSFSNLTFAAVMEPLRVANRVLGKEHFRWRLISETGDPVNTSSGIPIAVDGSFSDDSSCDALFVIASFDAEQNASDTVRRYVRRVAGSGALVGGLESGAYVLARAGLLDGYRATIHWEDWPNFAERFPKIDVATDRFVLDRKRFTTGGALPALDFMLYLFQRLFGLPVALSVSGSFIYEQEHSPDEAQHSVAAGALSRRDPQLLDAIRVMEANIEHPITISEVATQSGIGVRELQRRFHAIMQTTPVNYYASLRLTVGLRLVENTRKSINDIAIQCGYNSGSAFARVFRAHFGRSPLESRNFAHGNNQPVD